MTPESFRSESIYAGIPYRVLGDATVEALMPNGDVVNFKTVEQFVASANNGQPKKFDPQPKKIDPIDLDRPLMVDRQAPQNLPASAKPLDYYSLLLDTIKKTQNNSAQLRQLVYDKMRFNFKRDLLFGHSTLGLADIVRHVNDFELAVKRIEANATGEEPPTDTPYAGEIDLYTPKPIPPLYVNDDAVRESYVLRQPRKLSVYKLIGYPALALAILAAIIVVTVRFSQKPAVEAANEAAKISAAVKEEIASQKKEKELPFPIPSSYGIYALSNNQQLVALQSLPIGIPDPRVSLSAEITKPSEATLTDTKPAFILFRRDLLNNAPQSLALRVVARVQRETKIAGGKATVTKIEGSWRIRNVLHELKVSPVPGQPEMIMARAANDAPLPAGRYALVLNRVGYDFTIAGEEQAPEFCLEGFEAANGSIFTQCKAP